jgi:hypothetical protein
MKRFTCSWLKTTIAACGLFIVSQAHAAPATKAPGFLPLDASMLTFEYGSEDGEVVYPCKHEINHPVLLDWKVTCADPARPASARTYFVHLRLAIYTRATNPKQALQVMYYVTDRTRPPGTAGRDNGSYTWVNLKDLSALHSLELSQEIENVNMLTVRITLPPAAVD